MFTVQVSRGTEVGTTVGFGIVPVNNDRDYQCFPPGTISFADIERIADDLSRGTRSGVVGECYWTMI
jgi:hypothetical protein